VGQNGAAAVAVAVAVAVAEHDPVNMLPQEEARTVNAAVAAAAEAAAPTRARRDDTISNCCSIP